jgi:hypothetical protein
MPPRMELIIKNTRVLFPNFVAIEKNINNIAKFYSKSHLRQNSLKQFIKRKNQQENTNYKEFKLDFTFKGN